MSKPDVILDNYPAVYEYYAQLPPDMEYMQQKYAGFSAGFTPAVFSAPDGIADQLDQLAQDDHRIILSMNHTHFIDQFPVGAEINNGKLGDDMRTRPMSMLAKDAYFRTNFRDDLDSMNAIPIFQPKRYQDNSRLVGEAGLAAIETAVQRMQDGYNLGAFWEGQRNAGDIRAVQPLQAGLFHVIKKLGRRGIKSAVLNVAVIHDNLDNPKRSIVHVNEPLVNLTGKRANVIGAVQDDLQQATDYAYALLDKVTNS